MIIDIVNMNIFELAKTKVPDGQDKWGQFWYLDTEQTIRGYYEGIDGYGNPKERIACKHGRKPFETGICIKCIRRIRNE